ncbi:MAG: hypothetical protein ACI85O_002585 [Saprospiraceae bacterium]|jgi:hypothetical protein
MYTSTVGKTFLKEYNRRNKKEYSAREFFDKVFHPLFFNHDKYLTWPQNSPFVQEISTYTNGILGIRDRVRDSEGKTRYFKDENEIKIITEKLTENTSILKFKLKKRKGKNEFSIDVLKKLSNEIKESKLLEFHAKINKGEKDGSVAIGFPASDIDKFATTSGLVTDLNITVSAEDIYLSWVGGMLSLGVGEYSILYDNPKILYETFKGWEVYRKFLSSPLLQKLPGNKITTWNGQWLSFRFDKYYRKDFDFNDFVNRKAIIKDEENKTLKIDTIEWSKLFFSLSNEFSKETMMGYIASIKDTNKTIGFIPFQFKNGRRLHQIYQQLFGEENFKTNQADFEALFGKHIKRACELGNIGLQALEPKDLAKYFKDGSNLKLSKPSIKRKNNELEEAFALRKKNSLAKDRTNIITFQTYKTWLIAMISKNKTEISEYTRDIAAALVQFKDAGRKNDRKNLLEKDFFKTNKKEFLKALDTIVSDKSVDISIVEKMNSLRDYIHFTNKEEFAYFILLLKFDFSYEERQSQEKA